MNGIQVSVIVPIYNAEAYIEECVRSILNQTFSDFELILVDDGSKDGSLELCKKIASQDSRVKVIHQENAGSAAAKNTGISLARGNYISFCDSDDTIDCDYIQNLYQGVLLHNADVCVGNVAFTRMKESDIIARRTVDMTAGVFNLKAFMTYYPQYMPNAVIGAPWNKLYKRSIIVENELRFNTKIKNNEDTHFNYEYLAKCKTVYVSDKPYYNYINRIGVDSASKGYIPNLFDIYTMTYVKAIEFLKEINIYEEYIDFQNTYYIGLVIGAINGIIKSTQTTKEEKIEQIAKICKDIHVCEAIKHVHYKNLKKQLVTTLIKFKKVKLLYILISLYK